jgi:hypothetical protein
LAEKVTELRIKDQGIKLNSITARQLKALALAGPLAERLTAVVLTEIAKD